MGASFPVFRLVTLLARQASRPIANRIKTYARSHPWFSRHVCMATGRVYNMLSLRLRMWILALRQPTSVPQMSDEKALEDGANLLGEAVLFFLGALIIIFEVNRQANKKLSKKLDKKSQWLAVTMQLEELKRELDLQQQDIDRLLAALRVLAPSKFRNDAPPAPPAPPALPALPALPAPPAPPATFTRSLTTEPRNSSDSLTNQFK